MVMRFQTDQYVYHEVVSDGIFHVAALFSLLVFYTNTSRIRAQMGSLTICHVYPFLGESDDVTQRSADYFAGGSNHGFIDPESE
jgi:hypothetical protein